MKEILSSSPCFKFGSATNGAERGCLARDLASAIDITLMTDNYLTYANQRNHYDKITVAFLFRCGQVQFLDGV